MEINETQASELVAMREWARDNREGTDKRVVPATLFIAIYGIFASTEPFTNFTTSLTGFLSNAKWFEFFHAKHIFTVPFDAFVTIMVVLPFVIDVIVLLVVAYISLFKNLVVQSLIIEACTIAKYGVDKSALQIDQARI